jgi:hypothetical protein
MDTRSAYVFIYFIHFCILWQTDSGPENEKWSNGLLLLELLPHFCQIRTTVCCSWRGGRRQRRRGKQKASLVSSTASLFSGWRRRTTHTYLRRVGIRGMHGWYERSAKRTFLKLGLLWKQHATCHMFWWHKNSCSGPGARSLVTVEGGGGGGHVGGLFWVVLVISMWLKHTHTHSNRFRGSGRDGRDTQGVVQL